MTPRRVEVTRPDKLLWPALGVTKRAYVDYLGAVADRMLPWLRDRPLSVIRAPDGVDGERYFQKNTPKYAPSWIRTVTIPAPSAKRDVAYTVCNDAATLAWLGNQAALEFHPAPVRRERLERPDLLVVDIDPPDDAFEAAVDVAFLVLEVLDDLGLNTLIKTTGGKGLHVVVPIVRHVSAEQLRHAATRLTAIVTGRRPELVTAEFRKAGRKGRGGRAASGVERLEDVVDHEGRPEDALEDRAQVVPERIRLLPEVDPGAEDAQAVDRASTCGARVAAAHRHPPPSLASARLPAGRWRRTGRRSRLIIDGRPARSVSPG